MSNLKLLIKFPSRERPNKFFKVLDLYYHLLASDNFEFVISCDSDDLTMNNSVVKEKLSKYKNLTVCFGNNKSKIEAVNADLEGKEFDILLLASDDMIPEVYGYDIYIKNWYSYNCSNLDGVLWLNDGFQGNKLNTLVIIGSTYYKRFNYIYHPSYKSLYCDTEFTIVSQKLCKAVYVDNCLIRHQQYSIVKEVPDNLYLKNDSLVDFDKETFKIRSNHNFNL